MNRNTNRVVKIRITGPKDKWDDEVPATFEGRCEQLIRTAFEELFDEGIIDMEVETIED